MALKEPWETGSFRDSMVIRRVWMAKPRDGGGVILLLTNYEIGGEGGKDRGFGPVAFAFILRFWPDGSHTSWPARELEIRGGADAEASFQITVSNNYWERYLLLDSGTLSIVDAQGECARCKGLPLEQIAAKWAQAFPALGGVKADEGVKDEILDSTDCA